MARRKILKSDILEELVNKSDSDLSELSCSDSEEDADEFSSGSGSESESDTSDTADTCAPGWTEVSNFDPGPTTTIPIYNIEQGPILPCHFDANTQPIEFFSLFFDNEIFEIITKETCIQGDMNKRKSTPPTKRARISSWSHPTVSDMKAFIGMIINMGLHPSSDIKDYFSRSWAVKCAFFGDVFPRDEFLLLFWNLHFAHAEENKKLSKEEYLGDVMEKIRKRCALFYSPGPSVAVDESTISFKGIVKFKVYNPNKPAKFGMKMFCISDSSNGYLYNFEPYMGKTESDSHLLKTTLVVKRLCSSLLRDPTDPPRGFHVYTDRYYTSPELADELWKLNMVTTGTVMTNRKNMPESLKTGKTKNMKRGDIISFRNKEQLALSWKDKRTVTLLSTCHKGDRNEISEVPTKYPNQPPVIKPNVVLDYTKHMGAVDRTDLFIAQYQFCRRTRKWYRKMFFWLLEVCIVNSYLLYTMHMKSHNKRPLSHKQYRRSLLVDLVAERMDKRVTPAKSSNGHIAEGPKLQRLNGLTHFMGRTEQGTWANPCVVCKAKKQKKKTIYFCKTCISKPALHPDDCYEIYHSKENF